MPKKLTHEEFIEKAKKVHGDRYDYSLVEYKNANTKVKIICKKHSVFETLAAEHLRGVNCRKCSIEKDSRRKNLGNKGFIEKAKIAHCDKYDYSLVNYKDNKTKVKIICKKHGVFEVTPNSHLNGTNCKKCYFEIINKDKRIKTEKFIQKAKEAHGDQYDYSLTDYKNSRTNVTIICKKHGPFSQLPGAHCKGFGCFCKSGKINQKEFIQKAKETHGDRYDYSLAEYKNAHTKVKIICKKHGIFAVRASYHINGGNCRKCSVEKLNKNKALSTEEFIEKAKEVHGDKYDYNKVVYTKGSEKVKIFCKHHQIYFLQQASNHLFGNGCKKCNNKNFDYNQEDFIKRAREVHGDKFDYSLVNYKNAITKVTIICKDHGPFQQTPKSHFKHTCPYCGNSLPLNTKKFIEKAIKIHDNTYDYSLVNYKTKSTKIDIVCKIHGKFKQRPEDHTNKKAGCPLCSRKNISVKERKWLNYLNIDKSKRHQTLKINNKTYYLDALDRENKIIWEFYGDFWHGNPDVFNPNDFNKVSKEKFGALYKKTIKREQELIKAGYKIISIWEKEWNKMAKTLSI